MRAEPASTVIKALTLFKRMIRQSNEGYFSETKSPQIDVLGLKLFQVIHPVQSDLYVFALCKDHKIRMWLASTYDCVMIADVVNVAGGAAAAHAGSSRSLLHQVQFEVHLIFHLAFLTCSQTRSLNVDRRAQKRIVSGFFKL